MTGTSSRDYEKCLEMSNYLCGFVLRAHDMLSEGDVEALSKEIACASTDLLVLANGNELPDEYYTLGHRATGREEKKSGWRLV